VGRGVSVSYLSAAAAQARSRYCYGAVLQLHRSPMAGKFSPGTTPHLCNATVASARLTRPHRFHGILPLSSFWSMPPMIFRSFTTSAKDLDHVPRPSYSLVALSPSNSLACCFGLWSARCPSLGLPLLPRLSPLGFLVILLGRLVLSYGVGGQPFEDAKRLLPFKKPCLVRWCPLELLGPSAYHKISIGTPLRMGWLVSRSYGLMTVGPRG